MVISAIGPKELTVRTVESIGLMVTTRVSVAEI